MTFATALNCMDGRVQLPVITWVKENYSVDVVDAITEAGMDGILSDLSKPLSADLLNKIDVSLNLHDSNLICIVGHHDCGGNPVDEATHKKQICGSVARLKNRNLKKNISIIGLWVDENWIVHKECE